MSKWGDEPEKLHMKFQGDCALVRNVVRRHSDEHGVIQAVKLLEECQAMGLAEDEVESCVMDMTGAGTMQQVGLSEYRLD